MHGGNLASNYVVYTLTILFNAHHTYHNQYSDPGKFQKLEHRLSEAYIFVLHSNVPLSVWQNVKGKFSFFS